MKNVYDDFKFCDEQKMNELLFEYNQKLSEVKINSQENNFEEKLESLLKSAKLCLHYVNNLIKTCKNSDNLKCLTDAQTFFLTSFDNIKTIYDKNDFELKDPFESEFSNNIMGFFDSVFLFLKSLFDFYNFEINAKIKSSLFGMITNVIEIAKNVNKQNVSSLKIFSLFKRK